MSGARNNHDGTVTYTCSECGDTVTKPVFSQEAMNGVCSVCLECKNGDWGDHD